MEIPNLADKWTSGVNEVTLGATKDKGGSRQKTVSIGGAKSIPFMDFDGNPGHKPLIAMDVYDIPPDDWNEALTRAKQALEKAQLIKAKPAITRVTAKRKFNSVAEALKTFEKIEKEHSENKSRLSDFENSEGCFLFGSPLQNVKGIMFGTNSIGLSEVYLIYDGADEHKWYIDYIQHHIIPFIELGMKHKNSWLYWSG